MPGRGVRLAGGAGRGAAEERAVERVAARRERDLLGEHAAGLARGELGPRVDLRPALVLECAGRGGPARSSAPRSSRWPAQSFVRLSLTYHSPSRAPTARPQAGVPAASPGRRPVPGPAGVCGVPGSGCRDAAARRSGRRRRERGRRPSDHAGTWPRRRGDARACARARAPAARCCRERRGRAVRSRRPARRGARRRRAPGAPARPRRRARRASAATATQRRATRAPRQLRSSGRPGSGRAGRRRG